MRQRLSLCTSSPACGGTVFYKRDSVYSIAVSTCNPFLSFPCLLLSLPIASSKATELSHILPLQDIKLGFYFSGHEFDGDAQEHRKSLEGNLSQDDEQEQEIYRDDQMKGILARLVAKVTVTVSDVHDML